MIHGRSPLLALFILIISSTWSFAATLFCEDLLLSLPDNVAIYKGYQLTQGQKIVYKGKPAVLRSWSRHLSGEWHALVAFDNGQLNHVPLDLFLRNSPTLKIKGKPLLPDMRNYPLYDGMRLNLGETPDPLVAGAKIYHMRILTEGTNERIVALVTKFPAFAEKLGMTYDPVKNTFSYPDPKGLAHRLKLMGVKMTVEEVVGEINALAYAEMIGYRGAMPISIPGPSPFLHNHDVFFHALALAFIPPRVLKIARGRVQYLLKVRDTIAEYRGKDLSAKKRALLIRRIERRLTTDAGRFDGYTGGLTYGVIVKSGARDLPNYISVLAGRSAAEVKAEVLNSAESKGDVPPGLMKKINAIRASTDSIARPMELMMQVQQIFETLERY